MKPRTDALLDPKLVEALNRRLVPEAAHEAIRSGAVIIAHGVIRFGAWSFPATPEYLIEIFNIIDRHAQEQSRAHFSAALHSLLGKGVDFTELKRLSAEYEFKSPVLNLLPYRYWITW